MQLVLIPTVVLLVALLLGCSPPLGDFGAQGGLSLSPDTTLSPEYEAALHSIRDLVSAYSGKSEEDLLALPDAVEIRSSDKSSAIRIPGADGAVDEIAFHENSRGIKSAIRTERNGAVTAVDFSFDGVIYGALASDESGRKHIKISFGAGGADFPRLAIGMTGARGPGVAYQGDAVIWDEAGNVVRIIEIERPHGHMEFFQHALSLLSPAEVELLDIDYSTRYAASAASAGINLEIARNIDTLVSRADRFRTLRPEPAAVAAAVNGSNPTEIASELFIEYDVASSYKGQWRFQFDPDSKRLIRARNEETRSSVLFDPNAGYAFFGGSIQYAPKPGETDFVPGFWLFGFYPARVAPRLLVSCEGESFDAFSVSGHVCLWSPEGKVLFEKKDAAADTLADLLREIDAALTPEEKEAVAWRGMDELPYLIGTY